MSPLLESLEFTTMLTKQEKSLYRSELFRHLDGLVIAPTAYALYKKGILACFEKQSEWELGELSRKFNANEGYLNVALRLLCSQGWLSQKVFNDEDRVVFSVTNNFKSALHLIPLYEGVVNLLEISGKYHERRFEVEPFQYLKGVYKQYSQNYGIDISDQESVEYQIIKHIEGFIVGPSVVRLGMSGMFHKYFMEASFSPDEFHKDAGLFAELLDIFTGMGWFANQNDTYKFTDKGLFFAQRASAYGVTVSYLPMFRRVEELIFGDPYCLRPTGYVGPELHVDREMNVWGSGGAHTTYFKKIDEIIIELFNKPISEQPKGILDMGCGNGAFIVHIFDVIEQRTLRGKMLEEYPLFLVGADFNDAALKATRGNLIQADIWAKVIWGDIGRPDLLAADLREKYSIDLSELLNVRTFLDHNRIWEEPNSSNTHQGSISSGAFAHRGVRINNNLVQVNLKEHFLKWAPYVGRFGLLIIELHTIAPELAAENIGKTAVTAYDGTHGFSDQYIVEISVLHQAAAAAGLHLVEDFFIKYPLNDLATISINLLRNTI